MVSGKDTNSSSISAFVEGCTNVSVPSYLKGSIDNSSNISVYLTGKDTSKDSQSAFIVGSLNTYDTQPAFVEGIGVLSSSISAYMTVAGEILAPDSDIDHGNWVNELDGTTLYPSIADNDNQTYVWIDGGIVSDAFEVGLSDPSGNVPAGKHVIHWVIENINAGSTPTVKVQLYQGTTLIAERSEQFLYANGEIEVFYELTSEEIILITNYTALKFKVTIEGVA